jgi:diadenylate cyclase
MSGLSPSTIAHSVTHGVRWQDAVDILLLTLVFSRLYLWLRHTVAVQIVFGLLTLVGASWIASHLGLILTSYLLSAVGAAATLVIVIVFQHEIRQGLSRVSLLRWVTERRGTRPAQSLGAIVAQSAFSLARRGKGALIVLPRRDSIVEHVTAGVSIEGRLSPALIEAIFTSTSSLHDGAVIVSHNRLSRAGVILPLATETQDDELGTRHRAALGLTSHCDALVVCVSEERRAVSLVCDELLEVMTDEATLRAAIARAGVGPRSVADMRRARPRLQLRLLGPHLGILMVVAIAWAGLALDKSHAVARVVPLEIRGVGEGVAFDPPRFTSVAVGLRSSQRELELLSDDSVDAYIDLRGAGAGARVFRVQTSAPAGIEVVSVTPNAVPMQLRPRTAPAPASVAAPTAVAPAAGIRGRAGLPAHR